ncbi:putative amidoligase domain-containing protein [Paenibacillus sp. SN-8-1]|uniref:putative amidoligase domain-containing protein n=1 Tax=Paenibacillus sp. SN-8-1 TaxID=3435409 RepID=UPI003D9A55B2
MEFKIMLGNDDRSSGRLNAVLKRLGYADLVLQDKQKVSCDRPELRQGSSTPSSIRDQAYMPNVDQSILIMNKESGIFHASSSREIEHRLRAAGMKANLEVSAKNGELPAGYVRRFLVRVFHLRAVEIVPCSWAERAFNLAREQREPGRQSELTILERRLEKIAVRALYTLGLDFGEVEISAGDGGSMIIKLVRAVPDLEEESTALRFAEAILEESARLSGQSSEPLRLGMDPEFLLYNRTERKVIPASRFLERVGTAGCDAVRSGGRTLYPIAELRPSPGSEPSELIRNLMGAMQYASRQIHDTSLLWLAGGMPLPGLPLGGHLHFSGLPLTTGLLRTLDNYLALPVSLMEDERSKVRRPRYGYLGDYRHQDHGGFEYRTLPSFLVSSLLTKGVVALASLIAEDYAQLPSRPLIREDVHQAFYLGDRAILREAFEPIRDEIRSLRGYHRLEKYIHPFLEALRLGRTWDESRDIRTVWKIERPS